MKTDQNHLTLPANLREAADDLPRLSSSEEYWRFRNLYTWAADRIDTLQADAEQGPRVAVEAVLRAIDNFEDHRRGAAGYTGPLAERVVATCRELERRVSAGWEPQRELADYLIAEFGPGMVGPAVVLPEAGVDPGAPAEVAIRALKHAKARGAFRVAGETFPLARNLREAATANPALADLLSRAADAIEVAMQHADEAEAITMAKTVEIVKTIEMKDAQLEALRVANASLATDAGLWAKEPPVPVACGDHGDVSFWSEQDGEVLSYQIGWLHGGGPPSENYRSQYKSREEWSARGWGLYASGDLHDGHESCADLLDVFSDGVFLSLDDYRSGRSVTIEAVLDAARAFVGLPPLAEDPAAVGPSEDDGE